MAAEIRGKFPDADIELIPSRGGRFEVLLEGEPIFEKSKLDRFPQPGEIVGAIEARRDGSGGRSTGAASA